MITKFMVGVTAIALTASTLYAQPGGGQGKGGGSGGQDQHSGGSKGASGNGQGGKAQAGGVHGGHAPQSQAPGQEQAPHRDAGNEKAKGSDARIVAPRGDAKRQAGGPGNGRDAGIDRVKPDRAYSGPRSAEKDLPRSGRGDDIRPGGNDSRATSSAGRDAGGEPFRWASLNRHDVVKGCPPGLARKNNGCTPPGLANQRTGTRGDRWSGHYDRPDWWGFNGYAGRYSYYDGRLLQLGSNGSILGYLPLLGGALAPGQLWPSDYGSVAVPDYYESYYNLGSDNNYRYYDDAFYAVDPQSQAISSIAALLTGDDFAVGQRLPQGYDVYNLPYSYRDEYMDGPDAEYRYSDGYIYEVDPTTQLIQTAIELLT